MTIIVVHELTKLLFCRPDTLDPALLRPGRLDRKVEFGLPDLEGRTQIFKIHTRTMNCERDVRFELLARLCPNSTGLFCFLYLCYQSFFFSEEHQLLVYQCN